MSLIVQGNSVIQGTTRVGVPAIPSPVLDTYTGAAAAYSTRLLRSAYSGPALRVRRSSDNAELDITFKNYMLDEDLLLSFVGANSGFVTKWYDQSGNGRDAVQSTSANQPRIVNAGIIDKINGKPVLSFNGSNQFFTSPDYTCSIISTFITTLINTSSSDLSTAFVRSDYTYYHRESLILVDKTASTVQVQQLGTGTKNASVNGDFTKYSLLTSIITGGSGSIYPYYNGLLGTSNTSVNTNISNPVITIGVLRAANNYYYYYNGYIGELINYQSNQSSNRTGIENNINNYYSIF